MPPADLNTGNECTQGTTYGEEIPCREGSHYLTKRRMDEKEALSFSRRFSFHGHLRYTVSYRRKGGGKVRLARHQEKGAGRQKHQLPSYQSAKRTPVFRNGNNKIGISQAKTRSLPTCFETRPSLGGFFSFPLPLPLPPATKECFLNIGLVCRRADTEIKTPSNNFT